MKALALGTLILMASAIALFAVRSHWQTDQLGTWHKAQGAKLFNETASGIVSHDGAIVLVRYWRTWPTSFGRDGYAGTRGGPPTVDRIGWIVRPAWYDRLAWDVKQDRVGGIGFESEAITLGYGETGSLSFIRISYGYLIAGLLAWPAACLSRFLIRRRQGQLGLCRHCGYDVRATPDVCPECGSAIGRSSP